MLFVFAAPSGTGKTSIYREILNDNPGIDFSVSATTRKKREGEKDGVDYFFLEKDDFEKRVANGEFVEYEKIFDDNYYGTLKSFIDGKISEGKDVIFDLDVKGAMSIKRIYKDKAVLIFIKPPNKEVIKQRLLSRGTESPETIEKRLARFDFEMEKINEFNYVVVNDDLKKAINEVQEIINKYKSGVK
ncbi:MAG: guanylate kinase [Ignavibacteriae bacterium]|nr:guanylate kinase [Ignavibacteriota bacterium]